MKILIITTGLAALLLSGTSVAQTGNGAGANMTRAEFSARQDQRFARLDANRDGMLTQAELGGRKQARRAQTRTPQDRVARRFTRIDTDRNGAITLVEMQAAGEKRAARVAARGGKRGPGMARGLARMDGNADGGISRAEFASRALTRFARLDANGNGVVTAVERQQAKATRQQAQAARQARRAR